MSPQLNNLKVYSYKYIAISNRTHDVIRSGSVNQSISLFDLSGAALHTIKFHEGFMGARIGPVSCLSFHPLR